MNSKGNKCTVCHWNNSAESLKVAFAECPLTVFIKYHLDYAGESYVYGCLCLSIA